MNKKRVLSVVLSVFMLMALVLPAGASADDLYFEGDQFFDDAAYNEEAVNEEIYTAEPEEETVSEVEFLEMQDTDIFFAATPVDTLIAEQPADCAAAVGTNVTFSVEGSKAGLSYKWQTSSDNGSTWKNSKMTGYNTDTLNVAVTNNRNGYQFRCIVTDSANNEAQTSNAATLTVAEPVAELTIDTDPQDQTAAVGEKATFTVEASGGKGALSYQWQAKTSSTGAWKNSKMTGHNTATLMVDVSSNRDGYQFQCVVTDEAGKTVTSKAATLTVISDVTIDDVVYAKLSDGSGYFVKQYNGNATSVQVLGSVNDLPVTEIGADAFAGNTTIQSVTLPNSITVIRERAFKGCTNLSNMSSY